MTYIPEEIRSLVYSFGVIPELPSDEQVEYMIHYITNISKYRCNISLQLEYNEIPRGDSLKMLERYDPPISMSYDTEESINGSVSINTFDRDDELIERLPCSNYNYCILPDNETTRSDPVIQRRIPEHHEGYLIVDISGYSNRDYISSSDIDRYLELRRSSALIEYINSVKQPIRYIPRSVRHHESEPSSSDQLRLLQPNIISKIYQQVRIRSDLIEALRTFRDVTVHGFKINGTLSELIWTHDIPDHGTNIQCHISSSIYVTGKVSIFTEFTDDTADLFFKVIGDRYRIKSSGLIPSRIQEMIDLGSNNSGNTVSIAGTLADYLDPPEMRYEVKMRTTDQSIIDTIEAYIYCTTIMPVIIPDD